MPRPMGLAGKDTPDNETRCLRFGSPVRTILSLKR